MGKKKRLKNRNRRFYNLLLPNGDMLCKRCKGTGLTQHKWSCNMCDNGVETTKVPCSNCKGNGKINWLDNATGKKDSRELIYDQYMNNPDYDIPF